MKRTLALLMAIISCVCIAGCSGDDGYSPDTWYQHEEISALQFQNCVIKDAFARNSGGIMVQYSPVCGECLELGLSDMGVVGVDAPIIKTHYCDCGAQTTVMLKMSV